MARLIQALVTGASSGLGREMVRQLVREHGMTVTATARRRDRLDELAAELPAGRVVPVAGDLADPEFRAHLWEQADSRPGGIDLLVNNAGLGHYAEFADQDPAAIRQIIELNVMALFDLSQKAAHSMRGRGHGQILQISSVLGFVGIPYSAAYVASKHAVNGLVKSLRYELRGSGVRVWAACPGRTQSEFSSVALGRGGGPADLPRGESTERVVRAILRGLHTNQTFLVPSWTAWAGLKLADWLPFVFDELIVRWARRHVGKALRAKETPAEVGD
ncbi:MAG: SDR family NAD(P)-dependent oxidoreductase [Isosphaeraceae bacterium]